MISGRTASDTHFSRPKPARATRRAHQSLPLRRDEELAPPPPYHSPHTSSDEYASDSGNSDDRHPSSGKVTSPELHESPLDLVDPGRTELLDDVALLVSRAGNALLASASRSPPSPSGSPPGMHLDSPNTSGFHTPPLRLTAREYTIAPVTPQRLALLSEMNSELQERIDQLNQQIEEEAASASTKLRRLEREVVGLRTELQHTQQRNDELEEVVRKEEEEEEELAKHLRQERNKKLRLAREKRLTHGMSPSTPQSTEPVDFAPAFHRVTRHSQSTSTTYPLQISPAFATSLTATTPFDSPIPTRQSTLVEAFPSDPSSDLLSQMQIKINELEKATLRLRDQKAQTDADVQKMMQDMQISKGRSASASLSAAASAVTPVPPVFELPDPDAPEARQEPSPGPSRQSTVQRKRSGSLPKKVSLPGRRPRVGLGNKPMVALTGKGKGKMRAAVTPLSFVPPTPPTNTDQSPLGSLLFLSNGRQSGSRMAVTLSSPDLSHRGEVLASPSKEYPFFNTGEDLNASFSKPQLRTLKSELGVEFGGDWKTDFEHQMFGSDFGLSDVDQDKADSERDDASTGAAVQMMDTAAMDALSAALDPLRIGEPRDPDEHILPLNSLRSAPVETFYLLDRAVIARPTTWISASAQSLKLLSSSPATRVPAGAVQDDAWNMYPDEDMEEEDEEKHHSVRQTEAEPSLLRREHALNRLSRVHERRISSCADPAHLPSTHAHQQSIVGPPGDSSFASTPAQYEPRDDEGEYEDEDEEDDSLPPGSPTPQSSLLRYQRARSRDAANMSLAAKFHTTSLQTMVQVWMSFQFVAVVVVFLYFTVRRGPTAIMVGRGGNAGNTRARGSRGAMSHRR